VSDVSTDGGVEAVSADQLQKAGSSLYAAHPEYAASVDLAGVEVVQSILAAVATVPRVNDPSVRPYAVALAPGGAGSETQS
jgi:hypothetical protein